MESQELFKVLWRRLGMMTYLYWNLEYVNYEQSAKSALNYVCNFDSSTKFVDFQGILNNGEYLFAIL